jgi:glycosyltransferase involved in cell wall biosynthesis
MTIRNHCIRRDEEMKKIGIDVRMISHSGIGIRIQNLLKYLPKNSPKFKFFLFGDNEVLKTFPQAQDYPIIQYNPDIYSMQEFLGHPQMQTMDILDIPHFNFPLKYYRKCIVTVHDLTPYVMREFFPALSKRIYLQVIFRLLKKVRKVVTVSENTKLDLIKEFRFSPERIKVIYNGLNREIFYLRTETEVQAFKKKYNLPNSFYLAVGIGKEHKNYGFVIRAMNKLWQKGEFDSYLAIAGTGGSLPDFLEAPAKEAGDKIVLIPQLDYEELPLLYQSAKALIFPSLYEGFGFPLIEAQAMGCPVLSSNTSVMPEILGNSALFFDPRKQESFLLAFNTLLTNESMSQTLVETGLRNIDRFRWDTAVGKLLEIYERI